MFVDVPFLLSIGACTKQVELFAATFPNGCEVTRNNLETAQRAELDLEWFGEKVFGASYSKVMAEARAAYEALWSKALAMYDKAVSKAWPAQPPSAAREAYDASMAEAGAAYRAAAIDAILSLV